MDAAVKQLNATVTRNETDVRRGNWPVLFSAAGAANSERLKAALHDASTEASQVCKLLVCGFSEASSQAVSFTHGQVFHASSVADFMLN
jgi:hypothetical protein